MMPAYSANMVGATYQVARRQQLYGRLTVSVYATRWVAH